MQSIDNRITLATSGHRDTYPEQVANDFIYSVKDRNIILYNGGAEGWDTAVLKACLDFNVPYILNLPFATSKRKLPQFLIDNAVRCDVLHDRFRKPLDNKYYHMRDQNMVDKSVELHIYWDGRTEHSGTYKTMIYARKKGIPIINWCKK